MSFKRQGTTAKFKKETFLKVMSVLLWTMRHSYLCIVCFFQKNQDRSFTDMDNLETCLAVLKRDLQKLENSVYPNY